MERNRRSLQPWTPCSPAFVVRRANAPAALRIPEILRWLVPSQQALRPPATPCPKNGVLCLHEVWVSGVMWAGLHASSQKAPVQRSKPATKKTSPRVATKRVLALHTRRARAQTHPESKVPSRQQQTSRSSSPLRNQLWPLTHVKASIHKRPSPQATSASEKTSCAQTSFLLGLQRHQLFL
jgi:hypothetical protein